MCLPPWVMWIMIAWTTSILVSCTVNPKITKDSWPYFLHLFWGTFLLLCCVFSCVRCLLRYSWARPSCWSCWSFRWEFLGMYPYPLGHKPRAPLILQQVVLLDFIWTLVTLSEWWFRSRSQIPTLDLMPLHLLFKLERTHLKSSWCVPTRCTILMVPSR